MPPRKGLRGDIFRDFVPQLGKWRRRRVSETHFGVTELDNVSEQTGRQEVTVCFLWASDSTVHMYSIYG